MPEGSQFTQRMEGICLFFRKLNLHFYCSLKHSLWGWHYVDWCCLDSRAVFGRILLMWDRRAVEKYVGEFIV